ncbi:MAG: discoidin domain-containing protein [Clostridia bacterium]|nr:discoidin domain-containing protein [Clostridia bacterium]
MKKILSLILAFSIILTLLMAFTVSYAAGVADIKFKSDEISLKDKVQSAVVKDLSGNELKASGISRGAIGGGIAENINERLYDGYLVTDNKESIQSLLVIGTKLMIDIELKEETEFSAVRVYAGASANGFSARLMKTAYLSVSTDGVNYENADKQTFDNPSPYGDLVFTKDGKTYNVKTKYFRITIEGVNSWGEWECEEICLVTPVSENETKKIEASGNASSENKENEAATSVNGTKLNRTGWVYSSSSAITYAGTAAAFDGSVGTYWHSDYTAVGGTITWQYKCPHAINIQFGKEVNVSGFCYTPRTDHEAGRILKYAIFASYDGLNYEQIYEGAFDYKDGLGDKIASWGNVKMKAIQIEILESVGNYGTAAEINLMTNGQGSVIKGDRKISYDAPLTEEMELLAKTIEKEPDWKISVSDRDKANGIGNAFDKNVNSYWHTSYTVTDGKITDQVKPPYFITVEFPEVKTISGFNYLPRQDANSAGLLLGYRIHASLDGENFEEIFDGNFSYGSGHTDKKQKSASWGNTEMKAIKIEFTNTVANFGSAAEISFLHDTKRDKKVFNTSDWVVKTNSQVNWGAVRNILDGNPETVWHTNYEAEGATVVKRDKPPFWIEIILPKKEVVTGFEYTPRSDGSHGRLLQYDIYVSDSDDGKLTKIYSGKNSEDSGTTQKVDFGIGMEIKRVYIDIIKSHGDYGSMSDFILTPGEKDTKIVPIEEAAEVMYETLLLPIDKANFSARSNVEISDGKKLSFAIDDGVGSFWQSDVAEDTVTLEIDFGGTYTFKAIHLSPRNSRDYMGYWDLFDVSYTVDGENYIKVFENYEFEEHNLDEKQIELPEAVTAKCVRFDIKEYTGRRVSLANIEIMQTAKMKEEKVKDEYILKIGSKDIIVNKGDETKTVTIDVAPYITGVGTTLIPLRGLLEQMGATIEWNGDNQTIIIKKDDTVITMQVEYNLVTIENSMIGKVRYTLPAEPTINNSRTFIPVRFVSEHLNYNVAWDGETKTITISR